MEAQFEQVTGYKLVGLGTCMEWIRAGTYYHWVIAQQGQLGWCPRLAGIPPPQGPMMPPPYPPVMAAALPVTAAASTQATVPNPPRGGGGRPQAESQPRKRDAAAAGVQGTAWDRGGAGVAEQHPESPALHGAPPGNVVVPSLGGGIPA